MFSKLNIGKGEPPDRPGNTMPLAEQARGCLDELPQTGQTRRALLRVMGLGFLGLMGSNCTAAAMWMKGSSPEKLQEEIRAVKRDYGFEFIGDQASYLDRVSDVEGEELSDYELLQGIEIVREEMQKYPDDFFRYNGLKFIRFLNNMKIPSTGMEIGGCSVKEMGGIYLRHGFSVISYHTRKAFHHEIFHFFDQRFSTMAEDFAWWRSNTPRGTCRPYYQEYYPKGYNMCSGNLFMRKYGQINGLEDRATFAEVLMSPKAHRWLVDYIAQERDEETRGIVMQKYEAIKRYYAKWSNGKMNEAYWKDLCEDRVGPGYFTA